MSFDTWVQQMFMSIGGHRGSRERNSHPGSGAGARPDDAGRAPGAVSQSSDASDALTRTIAFYAGTDPGLSVETCASEILAWRAWLVEVDRDGIVLRSFTMETRWPGPLLASGRPHTEAQQQAAIRRRYESYFSMLLASERDLSMGIHAVKAAHADNLYLRASPVVGVVGLSGCVIEHENGYRAERAMIRRLYLKPDASGHWADGLPDLSPLDALGQLAERYGCDVDFLLPGATPWLEAA